MPTKPKPRTKVAKRSPVAKRTVRRKPAAKTPKVDKYGFTATDRRHFREGWAEYLAGNSIDGPTGLAEIRRRVAASLVSLK